MTLAVVLLVALAMLLFTYFNKPVSFDGGMNLQVAQSLSEGHGYAREFRGLHLFPHEIQTNTPFVIPSAVAFKLFGVGFWQSQLVNLIYLLSFFLLIGLVVRHNCNTGLAVLAALATLVLPGVNQFGMNGYGEVIALFWWLCGTYLLLGRNTPTPQLGWSVFLAGFMLGLALCTKTVILIGVIGTLLIYGLWLLIGRHWHCGALGVLMILGGICLPLLAVEVWRFEALGGGVSYLEWWLVERRAITSQAGVSGGISESGAVLSSIMTRLQFLSQQLGLSPWLMSAWLIMPILLSPLCWFKGYIKAPWLRVWAVTVLVAVIYVFWWFVITPAEKVWLRRVVNGLILIQLCWVFILAWGWQRWCSGNRKIAPMLLAGTILVAGSSFVVFSINYTKHVRAYNYEPSTAVIQVLELINGLPTDAVLFGQGWYGAPNLVLYAHRRIVDIDRFTLGELEQIGTGYLLLDGNAIHARAFDRIFKRFRVQPLLAKNSSIQIYKVDFTSRLDPILGRELKPEKDLSYVNFTEQNYDLTYGIYQESSPSEPWVSSDAEIKLIYPMGSDVLEVRAYRPNARYLKPGELNIQFRINECLIGEGYLPVGKMTVLNYKIPKMCLLKHGASVRVWLKSDNIVDSGDDYRQLSFIISTIGFIKPKSALLAAPN